MRMAARLTPPKKEYVPTPLDGRAGAGRERHRQREERDLLHRLLHACGVGRLAALMLLGLHEELLGADGDNEPTRDA
jgi:hypothetical protein